MGQRTLDIDLAGGDWQWMAVHGGAVRICLPATWTRIYRDDGGLALQSPAIWSSTAGHPIGGHPLDLLVSVTTYANDYGVDAEDALQYLDRDHLLPPGVTAMASGERRWIAYCAALPVAPAPEGDGAPPAAGGRVAEAQIFVWKMADFRPPDRVRVATLQLYVPGEEFWVPGLGGLLDRLGDEIGRMEFGPADQGPVSAVTMRNIVHADILRFRLPWDWRSSDEDEDDLGGPQTSQFRRPDDAEADEILRVVVHDYPPPDDMEPELALESALAAGLDWEAVTLGEGESLPPPSCSSVSRRSSPMGRMARWAWAASIPWPTTRFWPASPIRRWRMGGAGAVTCGCAGPWSGGAPPWPSSLMACPRGCRGRPWRSMPSPCWNGKSAVPRSAATSPCPLAMAPATVMTACCRASPRHGPLAAGMPATGMRTTRA
ncbi:hypothetical protein UCD39_19520 [Nitrospirillum sp. BR 11752]|uniref:hypothetical protein n=1 Tax=Nitrospirillum sp. BR 11752 TaxID=3104293 RepID=UPI002ECE6855|nr:hypothetical protein [Nitrospirillum sp. BR 11752]